MVNLCKVRLFWQDSIKIVQKKYKIGTIFKYSYIQYCLAKEPLLHIDELSYLFSVNMSND